MADDHGPDPTDPYAAGLIRRKARELTRRPGFSAQECEDLEQELARRLLERRPDFDPACAKADAFTCLVITRAVIDLVRQRRAAKRDDRAVRSLDAGRTEGTGPARPRDDGREAQRRADLRIDLEETLAALPAELRALAAALEEGSVAAAARRLGIPRTTAHSRLERLRDALQDRGLLDF